MEKPPFIEFPKIARLNREIIITEKIDGANASIHVLEDGRVLTASRTKWITPEDDFKGFAKWVRDNEEELRTGLGFGTHFGEWWGQGIGRRYGLDHKRFSLFNVSRWSDDAVRPKICGVVPTLYTGPFEQVQIRHQLKMLEHNGSVAAPGFMQPEGIVVFHTASSALFKVTIENDASPKTAVAA